MKHFISFLLVLQLVGCNTNNSTKKNTDSDSETSEFIMYEMSEMAGLMEQMFVENKRLRDRILANDTLGEMPEYFNEILTRKLTDSTDFDQFYIDHARLFLTQQQQIYNNKTDAKNQFNLSIKTCITCHEVKCGGPIERIKKLYIK